MNKNIQNFENDLTERLSRTYYDELLYFSSDVPDPLINFNDILLLKKGQKYIHHTEQIFQKSISALFAALFKDINMNASVCNTDGGKGRGVNVIPLKIRVHFLGQEKFVGFPKVPWFNRFDTSGNFSDLYTVTIKKNEKGLLFIEKANALLESKNINTKKFVILEDFVVNYFGQRIWSELNSTLLNINNRAKNYQWFGLVSYYNNLTQSEFLNKVRNSIKNFDYKAELASSSCKIDHQNYNLLCREFFDKNKYELLLSNENFAHSFITSEWLFENLNNNDLMEKTYIVTGYIKSIEQLLSYVIQKSAGPNDHIGIAGRSGIINIDINSSEFFKATLGNMVYYLKEYSSKHIYNEYIPNYIVREINTVIMDWVQKERNGYFHKDNVYDKKRVSEIRDRTILLYFLIIASVKLLIS